VERSDDERSAVAAPEGARTARVSARRSPDEPRTVVLVLSGAITRGDVSVLCAWAGRLLESRDEESVVCDVARVADPDATTVDALARVQLLARASGRRVLVARASPDLRRLIDLMGLSDVLRPCAEPVSDLEPGRQLE
jgi:ABC-type transporter Mla MlaB component